MADHGYGILDVQVTVHVYLSLLWNQKIIIETSILIVSAIVSALWCSCLVTRQPIMLRNVQSMNIF